jgi:hypothetical protein
MICHRQPSRVQSCLEAIIVSMCVCMYIYVYMYICVCVYIYMCVCVYTCVTNCSHAHTQDKVSSLEAALSEAARDSVAESTRTSRLEAMLRQEIQTLTVMWRRVCFFRRMNAHVCVSCYLCAYVC